jgi:hypothetical protein
MLLLSCPMLWSLGALILINVHSKGPLGGSSPAAENGASQGKQ